MALPLSNGLAWTGYCIFATIILDTFLLYLPTNNRYTKPPTPPNQFVSEIFPTTIRAKGLNPLPLHLLHGHTPLDPKAIVNIHQWFYFVFVACDVVSIAIFFLGKYMPETLDLSLEEMGALFGDTVVTHMTADGHWLVEVDAMAELKDEFKGRHVAEVEAAGVMGMGIGRGFEDDSKVGAQATAAIVRDNSS